MNGQAQAVMLLLLGGAVLRATSVDLHLRYVKPQLGPALVVAGAVLVMAGAMTLFYDLRRERAAARSTGGHGGADRGRDGHGGHDGDRVGGVCGGGDCGGDGDGGCGGDAHTVPGIRVGWLLLLPVLGLLLVAPPALGSYAAERAGTAVAGQRPGDFPPLPGQGPLTLTVLDYATRAVFDQGRSLRGRDLELTGFLAFDPAGSPYLVRMVLSCCAADGRPIKVALSGNAPAGRPADTWVRVSGTYTERTATDPVNGEAIPYLEVQTWEQVDPPRQQYE